MARKIKPFKGWLPVPVLPAAQVQATSYAQHLAYLEWYIDYLSGQVALCEVLANKVTSIDADSTDEQYPSAKAVYTRLNALGDILTLLSSTVADLPRIRVNIPLQGGEADLTSLEYNNIRYKVPSGVSIESKVSLRYEFTGTITADVGNLSISMTIDHDDMPDNAVIERATLFGQYNSYFMQCDFDFSDTGLALYGPVKPANDHSNTSIKISKSSGSTSTTWTIAILGTDNADTGLFTADSDIYRVRFYYHIPD